MMKKNEGITIVSLVVTVVIMLILVTVGMRTTYITVNEARDNKLNTELGVVRQAIIEQYGLADAVGKINVSKEEDPISFWIGTRIDNSAKKIELPKMQSINFSNEIFNFYINAENYDYPNQEDYYYRLSPEDQNELGIADAKNTYVVNYKTGEVYNETKKITSDSRLLYIPSTVYEKEKIVDDTSFNDWNN